MQRCKLTGKEVSPLFFLSLFGNEMSVKFKKENNFTSMIS